MPKDRPPRAKQHDWLPHQEEGKVCCTKCGIVVSANDARRGAGPCAENAKRDAKGNVETQELSPDDIRQRIPKGRLFTASGQDHGKCNGCGEPVRELPFNSKLAMVACSNRHCSLYRLRLRFITKDEQDRIRREIEGAVRTANGRCKCGHIEEDHAMGAPEGERECKIGNCGCEYYEEEERA